MSGIIVVGVDGSETARKAAESARDLARSLGATLHVVTAFEGDHFEVYGSGEDERLLSDADIAEKTAENVAAHLAASDVTIAPYAVRGTPAHALIWHAETYDARIIVVGNKQMKGIGRVLGSVANSIAHGAPCDVLIVKTDVGH